MLSPIKQKLKIYRSDNRIAIFIAIYIAFRIAIISKQNKLFFAYFSKKKQ